MKIYEHASALSTGQNSRQPVVRYNVPRSVNAKNEKTKLAKLEGTQEIQPASTAASVTKSPSENKNQQELVRHNDKVPNAFLRH